MKTVRRSTKKGDQHWHPVAQRRIKHFAAAEIWRRLAVILQVTDHINNDVSTIDINNDIRCHPTDVYVCELQRVVLITVFDATSHRRQHQRSQTVSAR